VANKKSNLNIADVLSALDRRDIMYYNTLSDDDKKELSEWVLMRFMSSANTNPDYHLLMINDMVNVNFNIVNKHPELVWRLLSMCGAGDKKYHPWITPPKRQQLNKLEVTLMQLNPKWKPDEVRLFIKINTRRELEEYFLEHAYADDEIKELLS
jgi:hypothetical protein